MGQFELQVWAESDHSPHGRNGTGFEPSPVALCLCAGPDGVQRGTTIPHASSASGRFGGGDSFRKSPIPAILAVAGAASDDIGFSAPAVCDKLSPANENSTKTGALRCPGALGRNLGGPHELTLSVELSAFVLIVLYVAIAALKQSDAELVLPFSKFDLGSVLEQFKEGIPGGAFVAPILEIQVPLSIFYVFAPIVILLLHAYVVWQRDPLDAAPALLRWLAIWSPPVTIAIMRWRFTPFVFSRPTPPVVGEGLLLLHAVALILDGAVVAVALAPKVVFPGLPRAGTVVLSGQLSNIFYGGTRRFRSFLADLPLGVSIN